MAHIYATVVLHQMVSNIFDLFSSTGAQKASDRLKLLEIASFFSTFCQVFLTRTRHAGGVCVCVVLTCCSHTLSSFYKGDLILQALARLLDHSYSLGPTDSVRHTDRPLFSRLLRFCLGVCLLVGNSGPYKQRGRNTVKERERESRLSV